MQITIEDNSLIYIYLKEQSKYVDNLKVNPIYQCGILYDKNKNWIGLKIKNIDPDGENIKLPKVGEVDYPMYTGVIIPETETITILFDNNAEIKEEVEEECCVDIHPSGLYGIEITFMSTSVHGKEKVKPFIKRDI